MANYRNISINFWADSKVDDEFTPEDKYFYLYLLTNPHTNICGCYEISMKQMERETGYNVDTIKRLIIRMQKTHNVIRYSTETKEILIRNWYKYNWSKSENVRKAVVAVTDHIKNESFKEYVMDRVCIWYQYHIEPSVTDTVSDTETVSDNSYRDLFEGEENPSPSPTPKPTKHRFGEYNHVLLTDDEYSRLCNDYGKGIADKYIQKVDEYCEMKGKSYKNYNLAIRNTFMARDNVRPRTPERDISQIPDEQLSVQDQILKKLRC